MNPTYKKRVQEPYTEAWDILKTVRDDDSDEAWEKFRKRLNDFSERINAAPKRGNKDHIKCEKEYLEALYMVMLQAGEMAADILDHEKEN